MKRLIPLSVILAVVLMGAMAALPVFGAANGGTVPQFVGFNHQPGPAAQERGASGDVVPDSYIVVLKDGADADDVASSHGVARKHLYSSVFNGFSGKVPPGRLNALRNDSRVVSVSANHRVYADQKPDEPGGNGKGGGKNKPPKVAISSPNDGQTFASGASINFAGAASDNEEGDLTDDLSWTSDGNSIHSGGTFSFTFDDGNHTITASVTDLGGKTGSDSITITVGSAADPTPTPTPVPPPSGQVVPSGVARIGANSVATLTGNNVGVAIVDTGIDFFHSDLNVASACFTAYASCQDDAGHGTHVAGTVAALNNYSDVVGVAPGVTLYAVKVLSSTGSGTWDDVIKGLDWVLANKSDIQVVNMSLSGSAFTNDDFIGVAIARLHDAGISVVVSAGNTPTDQVIDRVPAHFTDVVMPIASTTALDGASPAKGRCSGMKILADTASYFTTDGAGVTISAPGEAQEDISKGCGITSSGILSLQLGGGTTRKSGTSMSAPHVAGVVAPIIEKAGGAMNPETVRFKLHDSADQGETAPLDSPTSSYSYDGTREGILDAAAALALP